MMETPFDRRIGGPDGNAGGFRRRERFRAVRTAAAAGPAPVMDPTVWTHAVWTQNLNRSDDALGWLLERRRTGNYLTGLDAGGWPDSTWILHSFYEAPEWSNRPTPGPNLGGGYDYQLLPPAVWERRRWAEIYQRFSLERPADGMPPGFWSFPGMDTGWPEDIWLPPEGSMAEEDFTELMAELEEGSGWPYCSFYFASYFHEGGPGNVPVYDAMIRDLPVLMRDGALRATETGGKGIRTPANIWSPDKSWLVYTDYELWATKVSGNAALINSLRDNPFLETFDGNPGLHR